MAAACLALATGPALAADAKEMMLRVLGTDQNVGPVLEESFRRAALDMTPAQRELALKCFKDSVCETGQGDLTVGLADGFGENVWRQVAKMEFIAQALTYPNIKKIIYTSARFDTPTAISDMRSMVAQDVDVIVTFPDAGPALLPTIKEATEQGILVVPHNGGYVGGEAGKDFLTVVAEDLCELGRQFVRRVEENATKDPMGIVELGGTPGNGLSAAWQKCSEEEIAKNPKLKLLGKADTNWTQEGSFQAFTGFLAQGASIDAVLFEYADGFRGGLRALEAANKEPNLIAALRTDEQGVFCDWEKLNDPDFKIFYASSQQYQTRIALTAAMMKLDGADVPPSVNVPFTMHSVVKGLCNLDLPEELPISALLDVDMLRAMYPK
ncbi:MAG: substrate-binding domain-containing protein [Bauldia sp.]